ncbi:hypothetical protein JVT61DRAFT_1185 [Boletus reticuloceps]|uniref:Fungal-type protein kinase domain-containing protein n=1 Tax=Boletus reticuloceps TaxID=495285 RepID=A0A8I2YQF9_9AGAM|nr:hypothetical protein JVT61DRAFT_1185 [Boletus reticuloceps]
MSYPLPQPIPRPLVDPHIQQSMTPNTVNTDVHPSLFFPLASLHADFVADGQSRQEALSAIYRRLVHRGLYSEDQQMWIMPKSDTVEESTADFFNDVVAQAHAHNKVPKMAHVWRSHGNVLVESLRKPDVILVPAGYQNIPRVHFRSIQSYCEVKYKDTKELVQASLQQINDVSNHISTTQLPRRFFIGMSLCGPSLTLILLARGAVVISKPLDIHQSPVDFLRILLGVTSCTPAWTGTDENFIHNAKGLTLEFDHYNLLITDRPVFISLSSHTRSSKIWYCHAYPKVYPPPPDRIPCVLKDCWMESGLTTDIDIHRFLQDRQPHPFDNDDQCQKFGIDDKYCVFSGCQQLMAKWDDRTNLPGIPIVLASQEPCCIAPDFDSVSQVSLLDATENILRRFGPGLCMQPRKHVQLVYETVGTPIVWFSCRREFLNAVMGATIALFNGTRKNVLHCDATDTNVMMVVKDLDPEHVVPDWPIGAGEYPKRAGLLFDWGHAVDQSSEAVYSTGGVTGTFSFTAAEFLQTEYATNHEIYHDLESLFWIMFVTSVNLEGPFNKWRMWQDAHCNPNCSYPFSFPGNVRIPVKPVPNVPSPSAPIWATPGLHTCSPEEVYQWKCSIPNAALIAAMDPYWTSNQSGKVFIDGMQRLAGYFRQEVSHDGEKVIFSEFRPRITPEIFLDILYEIREGIPDTEDHPSDDEIYHARSRYKEMLDADCGLEVPLLHPAGSLARSNLTSPIISKRPPVVSKKDGKRRESPTQESTTLEAPLAKRTRRASTPEPRGLGKQLSQKLHPLAT